jgi:hypothetical protein
MTPQNKPDSKASLIGCNPAYSFIGAISNKSLESAAFFVHILPAFLFEQPLDVAPARL